MLMVTYTYAKEVDWLAGRGYSEIGVSAAVKITGSSVLEPVGRPVRILK